MPQVKLKPKVAIATARCQFKVIPRSSKRNGCGFRIVIAHPFAHKEADEEHHDKVNGQWNGNTQNIQWQAHHIISF